MSSERVERETPCSFGHGMKKIFGRWGVAGSDRVTRAGGLVLVNRAGVLGGSPETLGVRVLVPLGAT